MLPLLQRWLFAAFALLCLLWAFYGFRAVIRKIRRGRPAVESRFDRPWQRIWSALAATFGQSRVFRRRRWVSWLHALIFYGFTFYLVVNLVDLLHGYFRFRIPSENPLGAAYHLLADLASLAALGRCVVLGPKLGVDGVLLDQVQGAELATEYLIHRGHRRIAHLSGPARSSDAADRIAGYRKVLARFGICPEEGWVACGDYSEEGGYRAAAEVLRSRPTAIFAANDQMALGALAQLRRQGLRVPDDLSLVGYDDIAAASYTDPPLTTIRQPFRLAGRMAVAKLLRLLGEAVQGPEGTLQMQLIERASVQGCLLGAW